MARLGMRGRCLFEQASCAFVVAAQVVDPAERILEGRNLRFSQHGRN